MLIFFDQLRTMMMAHHKVEVIVLEKLLFDAAQHKRRISFAHFRHDHADREAAFISKRARKDIRLVVELLGRLKYSRLRSRRNRSRGMRSTQYAGDGGDR